MGEESDVSYQEKGDGKRCWPCEHIFVIISIIDDASNISEHFIHK